MKGVSGVAKAILRWHFKLFTAQHMNFLSLSEAC